MNTLLILLGTTAVAVTPLIIAHLIYGRILNGTHSRHV